MQKNIHIVGIGGAVGGKSASLAALTLALEGAEKEGAATTLFDISELNFPFYSAHIEIPQHLLDFCETVYNADGLVWSSPLYHGSVSGLFKNTLDWLQLLYDRKPAYLTYKPIGLVGVSGGTHAMQAINSMEYMVRALRGWTVPYVVPINHGSTVFDKERGIQDEKAQQQLWMLGAEVAAAAKRLSAK